MSWEETPGPTGSTLRLGRLLVCLQPGLEQRGALITRLTEGVFREDSAVETPAPDKLCA